ncbi:MAG: HupE/UreJ family protein [Bacteroidia bacterium]
MTDFGFWFDTGMWHIADWQAYDHILFLLALCGLYRWSDWKSLLLLVTAFTLGHSLTLALAVLNVLHFPSSAIELAIPLSILITCLYNFGRLKQNSRKADAVRYLMALFFGLIHGLGFSFLLKSMLGQEHSILLPLFAFNVGLEAGQLLILTLILLVGSLVRRLGVAERDWRFFLSAATFGIALVMSLERFTHL